MTKSKIRPFDHYQSEAWPHRFTCELTLRTIAGGTPTDPKVAEGWLRTKLGDPDDLIREAVAEVIAERGVTVEEATKQVDITKHLNGFLRDGKGLFIGGRQVKAMLKEAASVAVASGKVEGRGWGKTNKGLMAFFAEHLVVDEDVVYLERNGASLTEPDEVIQRFVHTWRGNGIQYEEVCSDVTVTFTVKSDWDFPEKFYALVLLTGAEQGLGASRSQGMGRFEVTRWEPVSA